MSFNYAVRMPITVIILTIRDINTEHKISLSEALKRSASGRQ